MATASEAAYQIQVYFTKLDGDRKQELDRQTGSITGGPFGDGRYPMTNLTGQVTYAKSLARIEYESNQVRMSADLTGVGPHVPSEAQYNSKILINTSTTATVTLPRTAPKGAVLILRGIGAPVKVVAQSGGAVLRNWQNHNGSAGSLALITCSVEANADGNSAIWTLDGATGVIA